MTELRTIKYTVRIDSSDTGKEIGKFKTSLMSLNRSTEVSKDSMEKLANQFTQAGQKATVLVNDIDEVKSAAVASHRQMLKNEKQLKALSREYSHLSQRTGQTADRQERMNALFRLGEGATLTQKKQLLSVVHAHQAHRKAMDKSVGSMRALRGQTQNFGYQMADVAVQAQMGTNAMIILGQQGSQLAAGFGPTGAIVGAVIAIASAIGMTLAPAIFKASSDIKDFNADVDEMTGSLGDLQKMTASQLIVADEANRKRIEEITEQLEESSREYLVLQNRSKGFYKLKGQEIQISKEAQAEAKKELAQLDANKDKVAKALADQLRLRRDIAATIAGEQTSSEAERVDKLIRSLAKKSEAIDDNGRSESIATAISDKATDTDLALINAHHDRIDALEEEKDAIAKKSKAEAKAAREAKAAAKELQDTLNVGAKYDPNIKLALLQKQYAEERAMYAGNQEVLVEMDAHYANERMKITGGFWEKYVAHSKDALGDMDKLAADSMEHLSQGFGDAIGDAIVNAENLGDAMNNVFKGMLSSAISYFAQLALQQTLSALFKQETDSMVKASYAESQAFLNQAAVFESGLNAFKSTAAIPLVGAAAAPSAATAAIAYTQPLATAANTLNFAGAFDKGGNIPSGSSAIVSEYGDELVGGTMIYNGSQNSLGVTGREDTAKKMSGNTSNTFNVNSYGNASPEAIARAVARTLKKKNKKTDNNVYDSMNRGRKNKGKRFA